MSNANTSTSICKQKVGQSATSWAVIVASMLTLLAGCIPQAARDHARFLAALTEKVKAEGERFAATRQELDQARQRNMDVLEANALEAEQAAAHALQVWRIADSNREVEIYGQVRDAADSYSNALEEVTELRKRQEKDLAAVRTAVQIRSDDLAKASSALSQLAEAPDFQAQVKFFTGYGKAVNEAVKKAEEAAKKDADEAKKVSEEQQKATAEAAASDRVKAAAVRAAAVPRVQQPPAPAATQPAPTTAPANN
jgi:hypothetical protein